MKTFWTIVGWIFGILIFFGLIGAGVWFIKLKPIWDAISFKNYSFSSADLDKLSLSDIPTILSGGEKQINVDFGMDVQNDSNTAIKFGNIKGVLSYKGQKIAETSPALEAKTYTLPANGSVRVEDTIALTLNQAGGQMIVDKIGGRPVKIDLAISLSALGIPRMLIPTFNTSFDW